ncbi:MAG: M23 family metallopeptidase [Rhodocyclaceae bacterium]|nr:MAG: M23 family metallopeptidase [Rhodocyclaceae bacterium]
MINGKTGILAYLQDLRDAKSGPSWVAMCTVGVLLFSVVAAFGTSPSTLDLRAPQQSIIERLSLPDNLAAEKVDGVFVREERIQRGDSIASLMIRLGIQDESAFQFLRENRSAQAISKQLSPGKLVTARVGENGELQDLIYPLNGKDRGIFIERRDGRLDAREQALQLETQVQMASGEIRYSLFGATDAAGLPDSVAIQLADIFGGDIDFHRDLRRGDRFSVVYESSSYLGRPMRTDRILAAEFANNGKIYRAVWYEDLDGKGGYYTADGKNIRKAFLRSPLEFSRITSGFTSSRFHPILKKWRAHQGIDYGAPTGTRVKSTADGVVEFVGNHGGHGRTVILRHQGHYKTLYGHLSRFAPGIRKNARITQGDVIGFVGSTGWSTGPHLHYEFRNNDVFQNPLTVSIPSAPPLGAAQLSKFLAYAQPRLDRLNLIKNSNLALLD